jgi:signal transduction histidine kinase/CheY-like chemotaxis protein
MTTNNNRHFNSRGVPLGSILVIPFVLQIFTTVGVVGYLSFRNGQQIIYNLTQNLSIGYSDRVEQNLDTYLALPHQIAEINVDVIKSGLIDIKDFKKAGRFFWKQAQVNSNINLICYYLPTGEGVGAGRWLPKSGVTIVEHSLTDGKDYTYATNAQGARTKVLDATEYFAPKDQWYIEAVKFGKPKWSKIYTADGFSGYVAASAIYPFYDNQGNLLGVFGIDLLLSEISKFLQNLALSPNSKVFVVERDGVLIGNSSLSATYNIVDGKTQRLKAINSSDPSIKATAQYLQKQYGGFNVFQSQQQLEFPRNGQRQFVNVMPWRDRYGLDWLVVVTIPESDFTVQINENTRITLLLCLAALMIATLLGMITSRWITQPILRLSRASQAIASGDLDQNVQVKGIRELQGLSQAFNRMAEQLRDWVNLLESRVAERTTQLAETQKSAEAAKEVAIAANRSKSQFLANMSHELRTPLNAILGFAQIMTRDNSLSNEQHENLRIIGRSGEHLLGLINDVLDMSKIEAGKINLYNSDFDLYCLLGSVQEMLQYRAKNKGLNFISNCAEQVPRYINSDEKKLRQVLINLLGNAIKFTDLGYVSLKVEQDDLGEQQPEEISRVRFVVEDSGVGIASNELNNLFEPFVQTESGKKTEKGTGLGLSISRKFVELMGGTLQVSSRLGQGSRFEFTIPLRLSTMVPSVQSQQTRRVVGLSKSQPRYRILVVDDNWENRQLLIKLLEPIGFEVKEATNGQEAITCWEYWKPHLIWMDMRMPVLNGFEATQQIKAYPQGQNTTIIALTASALNEDIPVIRAAGCDSFVRKPFLESEIFEKMGQYLNIDYTYKDQPVNQQEPVRVLTQESLAVMPLSWLTDLFQASTQLDTETIIALIDQIPEEYISLRKSIQAKVDNFDFDQIMILTQQAGKM